MLYFVFFSLNYIYKNAFSFQNTFTYHSSFFETNTYGISKKSIITKSKKIIPLLEYYEESLSKSMIQTFILGRSVSFSSSKFLSQTYSQLMISNENHIHSLVETYYDGSFLFIFSTFFPSFTLTEIPIKIKMKDYKIPPEILFSIILGSLCVFSFILSIVILFFKRKKELKNILNEYDIFYSQDNEDKNETESKDPIEVNINLTKVDSPYDDSWL